MPEVKQGRGASSICETPLVRYRLFHILNLDSFAIVRYCTYDPPLVWVWMWGLNAKFELDASEEKSAITNTDIKIRSRCKVQGAGGCQGRHLHAFLAIGAFLPLVLYHNQAADHLPLDRKAHKSAQTP